MVGHGGFGTTLLGLAGGAPMVVMPLFADQPYNARRVQAVGALPRAARRLNTSPTGAWKDPATADVQRAMPRGAMQERVDELDPAVVEQARQGDHRAFRELVRQYDPGLRRLAFRLLGDAARMDDVLQEAYVKAYRGLSSFRGDSSVATWVYRITYNACLDDLRRRSRTEVPMEEAGEGPTAAPDPADRAVLRSGLAAALAALPPDQRAAVLLVDAEGFDYGAAAQVLGVAEGTVASRVSRARSALRKALGDGGRERR